ncbi:MAG: hypothetical protein A2Y25_06270 [Candidatus Melainabacteria bacterium GWF2_37_15]|nr:MAG: hypothetical protein A2Y25_06270 [Candidatus Melainabacteria bacterium GWF2_37_15]
MALETGKIAAQQPQQQTSIEALLLQQQNQALAKENEQLKKMLESIFQGKTAEAEKPAEKTEPTDEEKLALLIKLIQGTKAEKPETAGTAKKEKLAVTA